MDSPSFDLQQAKRVLEAALLTSAEPLQLNDLKKLFDEDLSNDVLRNILTEIAGDWEGRSVELINVASGWRFRARPEYTKFLDRMNPQRAPKYSRAVMETLAIIAYKQPVTRGDIEDIRGVAVSPNILKALQARGWIDAVGHREVPGRPELFATTRLFLDDLGLRSLTELPTLDDLGQLVDSVADGATVDLDLDTAAEGGDELVHENDVLDDADESRESEGPAADEENAAPTLN
jgi:segregation and condensation protein B